MSLNLCTDVAADASPAEWARQLPQRCDSPSHLIHKMECAAEVVQRKVALLPCARYEIDLQNDVYIRVPVRRVLKRTCRERYAAVE